MNGTGDGEGGKLQFTMGSSSYAVTDGRLIYSSSDEVAEVPLDSVTYVRARKRDTPVLPLLALGSVVAGAGVLAAPLAGSYAAALSAYGLPNLIAGGLLLAGGVGAAAAHLWDRYGPGTATVEIGGEDGPLLEVPVPAASIEGGELEQLMDEIESRAGASTDETAERVEDAVARELGPLNDRVEDIGDELDELRDAISRDIASVNNGLSADIEELRTDIRGDLEGFDDRLTSRMDENADSLDHLGGQMEELDDKTLQMLERVSDYVELLTETARGDDSPDFPKQGNNGDGTSGQREQRLRQ